MIQPTHSSNNELQCPLSFKHFYTAENAVYGTIALSDCTRSDAHKAMFDNAHDGNPEGILESYKRFGRLKPVFGIPQIVDGKTMCSLIDGNLYADFARTEGLQQVFACIITITNEDEITKIMAQLQSSNHNNYTALFRTIQSLWPIFYKGQGYRSDLDENELDQPRPCGEGTKRLTIYEKIGREIGLSGNAVKFIRKIGLVNPLHFSQIETSRHSLYAAYLACRNEQIGFEPTPPKVKAPNFIRTSTVTPSFEEASSTTTPNYSTSTTTKDVSGTEATPSPTSTSPAMYSIDDDDAEFILVRGICECCGEETNIKISKSTIK